MRIKRRFFGFLILLLVSTSLFGCVFAGLPDPPTDHPPGEIIAAEDHYGTFFAYIPETLAADPEILVLVHGTPEEDDALSTARYYANLWSDFAAERGFILIVPAFNQEDFSSRKGDQVLGGYRGLFGRQINADEWVLRLVRAHKEAHGSSQGKFYLYGHSAGGQFVARFLVTHPETVKKAVITAAATYPYPTMDILWPYGMGELYTTLTWDSRNTFNVVITPDEETWLAATQVPVSVIVGLDDNQEQPARPGQQGNTRFMIGRNWVKEMCNFAAAHEVECLIRSEMIPAKGHSMTGLVPFSQAAMISE
jgi:poly(3-hydroxybutyrate) depolymerase